MPIYQYKCNACNKEYEIIQRMSDKVLTDCEYCATVDKTNSVSKANYGTLEKQIAHTSTPIFKGKGFYTNDYRGAKKPR